MVAAASIQPGAGNPPHLVELHATNTDADADANANAKP